MRQRTQVLNQKSTTDDAAGSEVVIDLNAAIVGMIEDAPQVLVVRPGRGAPGLADGSASAGEPGGATDALPFGPFEPESHRTLEIGLRSWVEEQTSIQLGYVEQLYTFGDRGRYAAAAESGSHSISVGYLALTRHPRLAGTDGACWRHWYLYFPWEDWRASRPRMVPETIEPLLKRWARTEKTRGERAKRLERVRLCFGLDGGAWDEEKVLDRYELLYEARLVGEALRDRGTVPVAARADRFANVRSLGVPMRFDHRRILATAMGRLRGKLKYRPVVFELMPRTFTLFQLQRTVEAIAGIRLHKQNFRRLVEKSGLVERTGCFVTQTGGRPAEQFRFRQSVVRERLAAGVKLPNARLARRFARADDT